MKIEEIRSQRRIRSKVSQIHNTDVRPGKEYENILL